jgi:ComF family protein
MKTLEELLDLLLPTKCVLCGLTGSPICVECQVSRTHFVREVSRGRLRGWAISEYGPMEQALMKAFKEGGITSLAPFLAESLSQVFAKVTEAGEIVVVPVPSSRANYIKRGYVPAKILAKTANRFAGGKAKVVAALRFSRVVADQAGLSTQQRAANLANSMVADARVTDRKVLLFDDVVTTGATLLEADRAVSAAGGKVVGFVTFSETILKTAPKN